jgi:hypothetical protein
MTWGLWIAVVGQTSTLICLISLEPKIVVSRGIRLTSGLTTRPEYRGESHANSMSALPVLCEQLSASNQSSRGWRGLPTDPCGNWPNCGRK